MNLCHYPAPNLPLAPRHRESSPKSLSLPRKPYLFSLYSWLGKAFSQILTQLGSSFQHCLCSNVTCLERFPLPLFQEFSFQKFSTQGHFDPSKDIWECRDIFGCLNGGRRDFLTSNRWQLGIYAQCTGQPPTPTKNHQQIIIQPKTPTASQLRNPAGLPKRNLLWSPNPYAALLSFP